MNQFLELPPYERCMKKAMKTILESPDQKRDYNQKLFTTVAPKYDLVTRVLSFGLDASWKRALIRALPPLKAPACLDLASGSGDIAFALAARYNDASVIGLDLTESMLERARARSAYSSVSFVQGDMGALPFGDESFDIVTGGYALRNAPDIKQALKQVARVLKSGGTAAFLDFSKPTHALGQRLYYMLLKVWGSFWGFVFHKDASVYGYIADSLQTFPDREELKSMAETCGLQLRSTSLYLGGMIQIIICEKKA